MKRILSLTISAVTAAGIMTCFPAASPLKSADAAAVTHNEWTGKNGAEKITGVNRMFASNNPVPYQDAKSAAAAVWDYNAREDSDFLQMLTGNGSNWDLKVVQNPESAQKYINAGFANASYSPDPADGWKKVQLPNSWTAQGFDFPIYCNVQMPWQNEWVTCPEAPTKYNPVGLYRKKFTPDKSIRQS